MEETDAEAFCRAISPRLVGALFLQSGDQALAEDVAQEALARAWERWGQVSALDHREGWAFRVAFNLIASQRRRTGVARRRRHLVVSPDEARGDDVADRVAVRDALIALPPRQRAAIVCRYYADLPVSATAEVLGCAEGTVKALCHQGIESLRRALGGGLEATEGERLGG